MKKVVIRTLMALAAIIAIILIIASMQPDTFRVERSITINASQAKVFALVNDLHQWNSWSPFEKLDPAMKKTFSGRASGVGAVYEWDGNGSAGAGRMEIIDTSSSTITFKLDFLRPFEGHNTAEFIFQPEGNGTKVTWAMYGPNNFAGKVIGLFLNMDKALGKEFEEGLSNLKSLTEA